MPLAGSPVAVDVDVDIDVDVGVVIGSVKAGVIQWDFLSYVITRVSVALPCDRSGI